MPLADTSQDRKAIERRRRNNATFHLENPFKQVGSPDGSPSSLIGGMYVSLPPLFSAPAAPVLTASNITAAGFTVTWTATTATSYIFNLNSETVIPTVLTDTSAIFTGLMGNTQYTLVVTGINRTINGGGTSSATIVITTLLFAPLPTPSILSITASPAVPIVGQPVTFTADLSGSAPRGMTYAWFSDVSGTGAAFTRTYSSVGQILVRLSVTSDVTNTYSQTFGVVATAGDTMTFTNAIQNFIVPTGYPSMQVNMLGGGGGGGGGEDPLPSASGGGGGGGGGGALITGICDISANSRISIIESGTGTGGAGGYIDGISDTVNATDGFTGKTLTMTINGSNIVAGGGGGGAGGFYGGGGGGGTGFAGISGLSIVSGQPGISGLVNSGSQNIGGSGGPPNGGKGGDGAMYTGDGGSSGVAGGAPTFTISFGAVTPTILKIIPSVTVPIVGQPVTFTADLSGTLPPNTVYEWTSGTSGSNTTFTRTYSSVGQIEVTLTLRNGAFTSSYTQTFGVVAAVGDAFSFTNAIQNFIVPVGYPSMKVYMLGGGGGGGGGLNDGGAYPAGGGGGGGALITGTCDISANSRISIIESGTGAGGRGGDLVNNSVDPTNGSTGTTLTMMINGSSIVAGGGGGGGTDSNPTTGGGGGTGIAGINGLSIVSGQTGLQGRFTIAQANTGGAGGAPNGGQGGNRQGSDGSPGGAASFTISFGTITPTILKITPSVTVPIVNQPVTFTADLSGTLPPNTTYEWTSDITDTSAAFTRTYSSAGQILVTLTLRNGLFTSTYSQTFGVVATAGNPFTFTNTLQNFIVPPGYPLMMVYMLGGGGGGGSTSFRYNNLISGSGGGSGALITGTCDISANSRISIIQSGTGAGGTRGYSDGPDIIDATNGSNGTTLTMMINNSSIVAGGGGGGSIDSGNVGTGGSGSSGISGLIISSGNSGIAGVPADPSYQAIGGLGGTPNGGQGGNSANPDGYDGVAGGAATFSISFGTVAPLMLNFTPAIINTVPSLNISGFTSLNVDWGNGTLQSYSSGPLYGQIKGTSVKIYGAFTGFDGGSNYQQHLTSVGSWGPSQITSLSYAFQECELLRSVATPPSTVTDMSCMFNNAVAFNQNISGWNVSNVTDMSRMFDYALAFNQNISGWNVSNVTDMSRMFDYALAFNQNISGWNVSNVTDMSRMFNNAVAFNQDISGWNVSNVTDMSRMFDNAVAFNQNISGWNVHVVTNMSGMFTGSSFDQNLASWNIAAVTDMSRMFNYATALYQDNNFKYDLTGWIVTAVNSKDFFFSPDGNTNTTFTDPKSPFYYVVHASMITR